MAETTLASRAGPAAARTTAHPPSPAQPGLWFASSYGDDPTAYNQPLVLRPRVRLDHDHLAGALRAVHAAHSALRTTFELDDGGELRQVVHDDLPAVADVRDEPAGADRDAWIAAEVAEVAGTVFDLRAGPLVRVRHLRLAHGGPSVLVLNVHHTVFDGMSWKPFLAGLEAAYAALARGERPARDEEPRQAVDAYARWADRVAAGDAALRHWRERLGDAPVAPRIGTGADAADDSGPVRNSSRRLALDAGQSARLRAFCAAEGVTTSMFFLALGFVLVHRHTGRDDVLLGMPVTVRESADAGVVGHLTNTVVLRHRLGRDDSVRDVLRAVKRETLEALRHRHTPLDAVVNELRATGGTTELFNAMITVMPAAARRLDLREWGVETWEYTPGGAKYDLAIVVDEGGDRFTLVAETAQTAEGAGGDLAGHLVHRLGALAGSLVADPDAPVLGTRWTGEAEDAAIRAATARRADAPALGTELTADLFAGAAAEWAGAPAVEADGTTTTYAELAARAERVAAGLAARGVRDGQPVGVLMRPGVDLVTTVLGTLRAGGAYVTFDPGQPAERLAGAVLDCGAGIVLHDPDVDVSGIPSPGPKVLTPDELDRDAAPVTGPRKAPGDPAYVVYTSGSTGRPKGVVIEETTLANLVHNQATMSAGRRMRTLQFMSPAFDVFAEELFGTLCTGGTLVVPPASARTDPEELADLLTRERLERVFLPYVALRELAATLAACDVDLPALREVYVTGERLVVTEDLRAMFRRYPDARLHNVYGPSEAHLVTEEVLPDDPDAWPALPAIGRVVAGVDAAVLDGDVRVPFGVEGELCVSGPVVSPGYLGRPEKTREVFVPDPADPAQRMYRTGDVVVLSPDGRLHYRGRADDQVKIRGYRVEPGEVESALERLPGVEAAAVVVLAGGAGQALHAAVRGDGAPPPDWRALLGKVLPGYMIPQRVTRVDTIPVTPNGKTDRRALAAQLTAAADAADAGTPEAGGGAWSGEPRERELAALWAEVLGSPPAGPDDDFFELGGHSLLAARLHRLARQRLGVDVPLSVLLSVPTVRGMAESLAGGGAARPDLPAEARLDRLEVRPRREPADGVVLVTGATGFLGSHLADELLRAGRRVRCLVRAGTVEEGRARLRRTFERFALDPAPLKRAEILPGDLALPRFGLGEAEWDRLAHELDDVHHAAAHINFAVPYATVKRTNVDGLRHVLDLCAANGTPLHLMSTLGVFPPEPVPGAIDEDTVPGDPASLGIGYSQSKWVADTLALRARELGLPVTVYRIGRIGGHSLTGATRSDDFFWLQLKSFAGSGRFPEDIGTGPAVDLLPVDHVAEAVVRLSEHGSGGTWHLHHATGLDWPTILGTLRAEGYPVEPVDRAEWLADLERQAADDAQGEGLGSLVPLMREGVMRLGAHTFENARTRAAQAAAGCPQPAADTAWIARMLGYFRALGALPPAAAQGAAPRADGGTADV